MNKKIKRKHSPQEIICVLREYTAWPYLYPLVDPDPRKQKKVDAQTIKNLIECQKLIKHLLKLYKKSPKYYSKLVSNFRKIQ